MRRFFGDYASQLEEHIQEGAQFGFQEHLNGMNVEWTMALPSPYIKGDTTRVTRSARERLQEG